jgi:hypothetical protein
MKRFISTSLTVSLLIAVFMLQTFGQQPTEQRKLAQAGFKFLSLSLDARAAGMSDAVTALEGYSSSMFYNPAGMARLAGTSNVSLGLVEWIADIQYSYGSIALSPFGGNYGVFGLSIMAVNYGEFFETIRYDNEQGYLDLGTFRPTALAAGIGYARALTDRFSVGGNVRYVFQNLGNATTSLGENDNPEKERFSLDVVSFDFGLLYRTGFRSLNFAMSVRNFGPEINYVRENFQIPLTFRIGLSMDLLDLYENRNEAHSFLLSVDAERPRDYYEQLKIVGEYVFMKTFALRAGYVFPSDEQGISLGAGLQQSLGTLFLGLDYSYSDFGVFSNVHRFSFQFSF